MDQNLKLRLIEKLRLTLNDGNEYEFSLTIGGAKRVKERLKIKHINQITDLDPLDYGPVVLWEALISRPSEMTEEVFAELVPPHFTGLALASLHLVGLSMTDTVKRPTGGAPVETAEASTTQ